MAFYRINRDVQGGSELADALDTFRSAWYGLANVAGHLAQMTNAQVTSYYGFADDTESGNAKAELLSGIGHLQDGNAGATEAQMKAAVEQMLNQFG
jgi:hypothetical protein